MTNGDYLRGRTDKELAEILHDYICSSSCDECPAKYICDVESDVTCQEEICKWLKEEYKEENDD